MIADDLIKKVNERKQAIEAVIATTKKRLEQLEFIKGPHRNCAEYRSILYEIDMCKETIRRGEKILKEWGK